MAAILRRQNASYTIFSDRASRGARALPVSGHLERMKHNKSREMSKASSLVFIAQKHFELLHTLAKDRSRSSRRTRWWVILDDDSFVFVDRLVQSLALVDDSQPLLVGGANARSHLCSAGLCDYSAFSQLHGYPPVVFALAGGVGYALSDHGLRRIGRALDDGACLDASLGDLATAGCARVAGVQLRLLPGGWMVNDASIAGAIERWEKEHFQGRTRDKAVIRAEVIDKASFSGQLISCLLYTSPSPRDS